MTTMQKAVVTILLLVLVHLTPVVAHGTPHDKVVVLTTDNFSSMLEDPANGLFLLKFYAPWCGHCKKLAPVLDEVAPRVKGKMAIGTIDCTTEKPLCNEYNIKSFPTLKFYKDGNFHDYPGGRKKFEFIRFANQMSKPAVQVVDTYEAALQIAAENDPGVAFVLYDKTMAGANLQDQLQSTLLAQVFSQVARKQQAAASFVLLQPTTSSSGDDPIIPGQSGLPDSFIINAEPNVDPTFWDMQELTSFNFIQFVKENNLKLVSELGPSNFHKIGQIGKPLVVGCIDGANQTQIAAMEKQLNEYARTGPKAITSQYYFAWMDGQLWQKFLQQFSIEELPQVFVLQVPTKTYYQNYTLVGQDVKTLLESIDNGLIEKRDATSKNGWNLADKAQRMFLKYLPYSFVGIIMLVAVIVILIVPPAEDLRPPYANTNEEQTERETFEDDDDEQEPKKEK